MRWAYIYKKKKGISASVNISRQSEDGVNDSPSFLAPSMFRSRHSASIYLPSGWFWQCKRPLTRPRDSVSFFRLFFWGGGEGEGHWDQLMNVGGMCFG